jgi:polyphenol oxidase
MWREEPWGPALWCPPLGPAATHLFTTRHLPLSELAGWTQLASSAGVAPGRLLRLKQVHGASVVVVTKGATPPLFEPQDGDGLITDDPSVALAVRVADCAPILLADRRGGAVGAVHAGWRGTSASIVSVTLDAMRRAFGTAPEDVVAAIGPAIGACCYDVGSELVDAFAAHGHARHLIDRWFRARPARMDEEHAPPLRLDIAGANRDQLVLAGVPETHVHVVGLCTATHLDAFTSFRAERARAGRMAAVIRPAR